MDPNRTQEHRALEGKELCIPRKPVLPPPYTPYDEVRTTPELRAQERLRRFISYRLALDYDISPHSTDRLTQTDWCHFISLSQLCRSVFREKHPQAKFPFFGWSARDLHHARLEHELFRPARAVGISEGVAVTMLYLFVRSCNLSCDEPGSSLEYIVDRYGVSTLAWKLSVDRDQLLDICLPVQHTDYAQQVRQRNKETVEEWFDHLHGPQDFMLSFLGKALDPPRRMRKVMGTESADRPDLAAESRDYGIAERTALRFRQYDERDYGRGSWAWLVARRVERKRILMFGSVNRQ